MPRPKEPKSREKPIIGMVDLQTMRYHLNQYVRRDGEDPPDDILAERMPKIREILADERLKGHFGFVERQQGDKMDHVVLRRHADVLLYWVERWLR